MFNQGISAEGDLVDLGASYGILTKSGSFYSYGQTRLGQGREQAKEHLRQHPDIAKAIEELIRGAAEGRVTEAPAAPVEEEAQV